MIAIYAVHRRAAYCSPLTDTGRRKVKVDPSPGVLSALTEPPRRAANLLTIYNPSPTPPYWRVAELSTW